MSKSKNWRSVATFVFGVMAGGLGAAAFVGWHWTSNFAELYLLKAADQANVAKEVYTGNGPALAAQILDDLPAYSRVIRDQYRTIHGADWALWQIRDAFETTGTTPDADLQALFASLPPRSVCQRPSAP